MTFTHILVTYRFTLCMVDPTTMSTGTSKGVVVLDVYVNDILKTHSDEVDIIPMEANRNQIL